MKNPLPYETFIAMKRLKQEDIWYDQISPHHLKVDVYNFYPKRGIIHIDGKPDAFPQRGLEVFVELLNDDTPVMARIRHNRATKIGATSGAATAEAIVLKLQ